MLLRNVARAAPHAPRPSRARCAARSATPRAHRLAREQSVVSCQTVQCAPRNVTCQRREMCVRRRKWQHQRPSSGLMALQARRMRLGALARREEGLEGRRRELDVRKEPSRLPCLRAAGLRCLGRLRRGSTPLLHALHRRGWHLRDAQRGSRLRRKWCLVSCFAGIVAAARTHLKRGDGAQSRVSSGRWRGCGVSLA